MTDPALDRLLRADRIQHHLVAALALGDHRRDSPRLVFKGGTLLRACAMPDYRYSEDLDFDWVGSAEGFFKAVADALPAASATSGAFLHLEGANVSRRNVSHAKARVLWNHQLREGTVRAEATLLRQVEVPTQTWPVRSRYPRTPHPATIRGYTLEMVIADKLGCISQRVAPRDFYDIARLLDHGADKHDAWALYTEQFNNPRRVHTWRPFPTDIRTAYMRQLPQLAQRWETDVGRSVLPPSPRFVDLYDRVDEYTAEMLEAWEHQVGTAELHRWREAHKRIAPLSAQQIGEPGLPF